MAKVMIVLICLFVMSCATVIQPVEPDVRTPLFIAAVGSEVFHTLRCSYVRAIAERKIVLFYSYEDAIVSGKIPCSRCKPSGDFYAKKELTKER